MKNVKVKIKNERVDDELERGESPMNSGQSSGSAVPPGSAEITVSGVGSGLGSEGGKGEIGEKANENEVSSADAEALADKSFKFLISSGENNRTGRTQGTDGNAPAIGNLKFQISEGDWKGSPPRHPPSRECFGGTSVGGYAGEVSGFRPERREGNSKAAEDCRSPRPGGGVLPHGVSNEGENENSRLEISEPEKDEDESKAKHQMEDGGAPLPVPPPTTASRGEGDDCAADRVGRGGQDSAAGSSGDGGAEAGGAGIGDLKFQISEQERNEDEKGRRKTGQNTENSEEKSG